MSRLGSTFALHNRTLSTPLEYSLPQDIHPLGFGRTVNDVRLETSLQAIRLIKSSGAVRIDPLSRQVVDFRRLGYMPSFRRIEAGSAPIEDIANKVRISGSAASSCYC